MRINCGSIQSVQCVHLESDSYLSYFFFGNSGAIENPHYIFDQLLLEETIQHKSKLDFKTCRTETIQYIKSKIFISLEKIVNVFEYLKQLTQRSIAV